MRVFLLVLFISIVAISHASLRLISPTMESHLRAGVLEYQNNNFVGALDNFLLAESAGLSNPDLYFNIGNAYFKQQLLPEAILYYERANKLKPEDKDILHNLAIAQAQTRDKIEVMPDFIVSTWIKKLSRAVDTDSWAVFSLIFLAACFLFFILFFFAYNVRLRKFSFFLAVSFIVFTITCFIFAAGQKKEMLDHSEAIIFPAVVTVKSAPNQDGKDLFILHEGTKVIILEELRNWQRIQLLDGKEGWVAVNSVQRI